jgi:hypothetical protein
MKYESGEIVEHILTGDKFIILQPQMYGRYRCRGKDLFEVSLEEIEIRKPKEVESLAH